MKMPQLSDTMHQGKIVSWRKKEGDAVSRGEALAEVETDKANLEIECFTPGTLLKILTPAGEVAKVGDIIAIIGQPGEQVSAPTNRVAPSTPAVPAPAITLASAVTQVPTVTQAPAVTRAPPVTAAPHPSPSALASNGRVKVSPLARKIAEQHQVDLGSVHGSGPQGRILRRDVEAQFGAGAPGVTTHYSAAHGAGGKEAGAGSSTLGAAPQQSARARDAGSLGAGKSTPLSKMRETIARRMQESVNQSPHFYVTAAIDMDQAVALREALKERLEFKGISLNHLVIKAVAYGLAREPRVNRALRDGMVFEPDSINVGIITAVEDGLLIPVIRGADQLPLKDVVFEARAAIDRARAGRPNSSDLMGGTFSISNMGMFDVENFTAIINPGQGAVLAVSAVREEPVVKQGQIVIGKRMKVTLSLDHRVIDGLMGAQFLKFFKEALEIPALLMN
jgi:pyruvate dehydrogenase E2 component (dihydrolipoamide acetyltransferase)